MAVDGDRLRAGLSARPRDLGSRLGRSARRRRCGEPGWNLARSLAGEGPDLPGGRRGIGDTEDWRPMGSSVRGGVRTQPGCQRIGRGWRGRNRTKPTIPSVQCGYSAAGATGPAGGSGCDRSSHLRAISGFRPIWARTGRPIPLFAPKFSNIKRLYSCVWVAAHYLTTDTASGLKPRAASDRGSHPGPQPTLRP